MNNSENIDSGKSKEKPTSLETIQKLRETEDLLINKQELLERKIDDIMLTVRSHGTKNMTDAVAALKIKKQYERHLLRIDGFLSQIEILRNALESDHVDADMVSEVSDLQQVVTDILLKLKDKDNITFSDYEFDEDELVKEIEVLEQGSDVNLLDDSTKPEKSSQCEDDEEFKKLESWVP